MERTKLLTITVVGLLVLNLLTVGLLAVRLGGANQVDHRPGPPDQQGPEQVIIDRLRFDSTQQNQYRHLIEQHRQQTHALGKESAQLYRDYYGLLAESVVDSVRASALRREIADNQLAVARVNFDHFAQIKALCHPDQQADFMSLVSDLGNLFGRVGRPAPAGGPPPGGGSPPPGRQE